MIKINQICYYQNKFEMSNSLKITCINAQLTRDTETFTNMDPYVKVQCGTEKRKTRTHQQGGKRPQWNDSFTFVNPKSNQVKFAVWDEDTLTDDLVGEGSIDLSKYISSPGKSEKEYVTLTYKNKPAGKLCIEVVYEGGSTPNNNWGSNNSQGWNSNNGNTNNNQAGWNTQNNLKGWGNQQNTSNGWGSNKNIEAGWGNNNTQGWGTNNQNNWSSTNNDNTQGWGNTNISNNQWGNNNNQGWGNNNPQNSKGNNNQPGSSWGNNSPNQSNNSWGNNQQSNQSSSWSNTNNPSWGSTNSTNPNNYGYQQPNLQKKPSNNNVNPYGDISEENNNQNPYPSLNQNQQNPMGQNPLNALIGQKLFGTGQQQGQQPPPQQPNPNAFNILDMAMKQPNSYGQPNNYGQGSGQPPQNPYQPNPWQNNKGSGWGGW